MSCHCRELQTEIAEHISLDKSKPLSEELRRKAAVCPDCREFYYSLKSSLQTLQTCELDDTEEMPGSLWPSMASNLRTAQVRPMSRQTVDKVSRALAGLSIAVAASVLLISPAMSFLNPGVAYDTTPAEFAKVPATNPNHLMPANFANPQTDFEFAPETASSNPFSLNIDSLLPQHRQDSQGSFFGSDFSLPPVQETDVRKTVELQEMFLLESNE